MPPVVICADRALTPLQEITDVACVVEDGIITGIGRREQVTRPAHCREIDARGLTLVPGFIDIHIHGAGGSDVMDADAGALASIASTVARYGTTSLVATTMTADSDVTCRALERIAKHIDAQVQARSSVTAEYLGIHLEGPFISAVRCGAQPADWIQPPDASLLKRFLTSAGGHARIITLAPEIPGGGEVIDAAINENLIVSLGHTDATYEQARDAIGRGARHATHIYNAMRPFSHRDTGVLGAVLTEPAVTAELIADSVHVDPAAMRLAIAAKTPSGVILVSDAISATGMPDGAYRLGMNEVTVAGGVCRTPEGRLAGSTLTLDRALRNIVALGVPLCSAVQMLTVNPARSLKIENRKGILAAGADADLLLLNDRLEIARVLTRGLAA